MTLRQEIKKQIDVLNNELAILINKSNFYNMIEVAHYNSPYTKNTEYIKPTHVKELHLQINKVAQEKNELLNSISRKKKIN